MRLVSGQYALLFEGGGLRIDYIYPGANGEVPARAFGPIESDRMMSISRVNHPVEEGFEHRYAIALNLGQYPSRR